MKSLLCFGEVLIDFLAESQVTPDAPRSFQQFAGGAPANVAVAACRLGAPTEFVGMLGQDMFGDFLLAALQSAGVGTRHVRRTAAAKTALAFVQLDAQGERSFSFYRPPAADLLFCEQDFSADVFADVGVLHVCSNSLTEAAIARTTFATMQRAREAGAVISVDLNWRPMLWAEPQGALPLLWQLLALADVVKLAQNELDLLTTGADSEAVITRVLSGKTRLLVVTDGAAPLRWFTRNSRGELHSFKVITRDTTAAGDAFVGGLLTRILNEVTGRDGLPEWLSNTAAVQAALRFASAVGAIAVTRHGAFAAMPTLEEVHTLLEQIG